MAYGYGYPGGYADLDPDPGVYIPDKPKKPGQPTDFTHDGAMAAGCGAPWKKRSHKHPWRPYGGC